MAEIRIGAERQHITVAPGRNVQASFYPAAADRRAGITLVLAHGAGAGQTSSFMVRCAEGLADRGIDVATFDFLYVAEGRRVPDPTTRLESCYRAVLETVRDHEGWRANRVAIGGKSMGGRIASHLAAAGDTGIAALVFLGYPLHPPGRPDKPRTAHLPDVKAPMLFVQGSRDAFGTPEELQPVLAGLGGRGTLHVVDGADHGFKVPKATGRSHAQVMDEILDTVAAWLRARAG